MRRLAAWVLSLVLLVGCATGAHLVTGNARTPLVVEAVKIYQTAPAQAVVIGTVVATAVGIDQCSMNWGLAELKRQAAKIGANGLIVNTPVQNPGAFLSHPTTQLSAQAIYVP